MITDDERKLMKHALTGGRDTFDRNFYAADDSHHNIGLIKSLVKKKLMIAGNDISGGKNGYRYYHVTPAGARLVKDYFEDEL